jgi:hypothetical protein
MSDETPEGLPPVEGGYELLFPFVVCQSNGGPFEDESFVAGAQYGNLHQLASLGVGQIMAMVYPALLQQIDLLAMHYGYTLATVDHGEWMAVNLVRQVPATDGETVSESL